MNRRFLKYAIPVASACYHNLFKATICDDTSVNGRIDHTHGPSGIENLQASCKKKVCAKKIDMLKKAFETSSINREDLSAGKDHGAKEPPTSSKESADTDIPNSNIKIPIDNTIAAAAATAAVDECPIDTEKLGNATWSIIHTIAAYYPDNPSEVDKAAASRFIVSLAHLYPCEVCAKDFQDSVVAKPPRVDSREDFALWCCELHNEVNEKLGKATKPCSTTYLDERWRDGRPSCNES